MKKANGYLHGNRRRITVGLDPCIFEDLVKIAARDNCSFAEAARTAIEWGLESAALSDAPVLNPERSRAPTR